MAAEERAGPRPGAGASCDGRKPAGTGWAGPSEPRPEGPPGVRLTQLSALGTWMRAGLKNSPPCGGYMGEAEAAGLWAGVWARGEGVGGAGPEGSSPSPPHPPSCSPPAACAPRPSAGLRSVLTTCNQGSFTKSSRKIVFLDGIGSLCPVSSSGLEDSPAGGLWARSLMWARGLGSSHPVSTWDDPGR